MGTRRELVVDIGWSCGDDWLGRRIAQWDTVRVASREIRSIFSHVYLVFRWRTGPSIVWESLIGRGVRIMPYTRLWMSTDVSRQFELPLEFVISDDQAQDLWSSCLATWGRPYDARHLFGLWAWRRFRRQSDHPPAMLRWSLNDKYLCSEAVERVMRDIGFDVCGRETPQTVTPHTIFRHLVGCPSPSAFGPYLPDPRHLNYMDLQQSVRDRCSLLVAPETLDDVV